ncbi:protein NLP2 isoform X2 [Juglans microcarpa x Juglans regia]|uniref:protein NLP2 isoform X2 n=1 Tax=Juglans microcarpa x Juglans regia TaxID=2249226 RepID=UPI001B7ED7B5|nr:protein NLP2 isoform X2 [Juglans microcarpa x Juglans regia]
MEDGVLSPGTMLDALPDSGMDLDFMDNLFFDGFWLEATDGSEFLHQSPSSSGALLVPSFEWPTLEVNGNLRANPSQKDNGSQERSLVNAISLEQNMINVAGWSRESENNVIEGSERGTRWWIAPSGNPGCTISVAQRLIKAVEYLRELTRNKDVLIQIWVPVNRGGRRVLTTSDQPYSLYSSCPRLARYRDISGKFHFSAEEDSKESVGLPGRVFLGKVPEWTPDVRFFRSDEYPRVGHAQEFNICGTLALPIFEQGSRTCLGVIEVVMTTQQIKIRPELESVREALEAVDLRGSDALSTDNVKACNTAYQAALPEIQEVLRSACETHSLPLAQTWVPCIQQGKEGCRHSDDNYVDCVSTVDHACIVADPNMLGFHEACSEHHLLKGQGIVGGAFRTNQPCFSTDITSFSKTEYPLSHHARVFGLHAAVAIHLRSIHTGTADFVLEFFLPVNCTDPEEQKNMLSSLSIIIQQVCQSLRVVTDKELQEDTYLPVNGKPGTEDMLHEKSREFWPCQPDSSLKRNVEFGEECSAYDEGSFPSMGMGMGMGKAGEKRRTKAEKNITLEVLRQYFAGSLKDAAKSIGVCPTTLKRICRQRGIKRWPSRKIKKVGHSLQKLQLVIDSVQGASGAFQINPLYTNFTELASPKLSGTCSFTASKLSDHLQPSSVKAEGEFFSPEAVASKSPSSCSQTSTSSQCCSSGAQQHPPMCNVGGCEVVGENHGDGVLKRISSEAEIQATNQGTKLLSRSQSHKSLNAKNLTSSPKNSARVFQQGFAQKVKVTYGEEKVRFRMQNNWSYTDLLLEIARRYNIEDMSRFYIKYLDDDAEWILLTCDADWEECIDVCQSSHSHTIKLSLQVSQHHLGKSLGISGPS